MFGEVENKTGNYVGPRFKVILEKDGQQVGSDYFGSLIKEPPQDLDRYEVREGKLKPGERGYYLVAVRDVKDLEFDQFFVSEEILSQVTEAEAKALRETVLDYGEKIAKVMEKWLDDVSVAGSTQRISLAPIVAMLQEDKRQFAAIEPPANPEVQEVAIDIQLGMEQVINGFLEFMGQNDDTASRMISSGMDLITKGLARLNELKDSP